MPQVPETTMICAICLAWKNENFLDKAKQCIRRQVGGCHSIIFEKNMECSVGVRRNLAIALAPGDTGHIAHFDYDDISAPLRLKRQLGHIQQTGKLVTGFYNMPMYDLKNDKVWIYTNPRTNYSLGNCLFYKREAWERVKFPDKTPEDNVWRKNIGGENIESRSVFEPDGSPLMIQVVHGANASASIIRSSVYYQEPSEAQEKAVRELLASA